jgi:hypothetical protein
MLESMHSFQPVTHNGIAVQAVAPLSVAFKTVRPAGVETFESARAYFETGRQVSCLEAESTAPYLVKVEFQVGSASGGVETGRYEDTRVSATEWKREAWIGKHYALGGLSNRLIFRRDETSSCEKRP